MAPEMPNAESSVVNGSAGRPGERRGRLEGQQKDLDREQEDLQKDLPWILRIGQLRVMSAEGVTGGSG